MNPAAGDSKTLRNLMLGDAENPVSCHLPWTIKVYIPAWGEACGGWEAQGQLLIFIQPGHTREPTTQSQCLCSQKHCLLSLRTLLNQTREHTELRIFSTQTNSGNSNRLSSQSPDPWIPRPLTSHYWPRHWQSTYFLPFPTTLTAGHLQPSSKTKLFFSLTLPKDTFHLC